MSKNRQTAILLAVFLSFWSWLYTYEKDKIKFWIGLPVAIFGIFLIGLPTIGVWIWAIVDQVSKDDKFFDKLK